MVSDDTGYPTELESDETIFDGTVVHVRPIRPGDASRLVDFHDHLSPTTVWRRFFTAHPHLSPREVERFTHLDYRRRLALIAEVDGELIGVGRFDRLEPGEVAEVAFVVADRWQHHGVATVLLRRLVAAARARGIHGFVAETMSDNRDMLAVFAESGFDVHHDHDLNTVHVSFPIDDDGSARC